MRILIVDDEGTMRDIISLILRKNYDLEVVEADSFFSAIKILQDDHNFDGIISDYNMPGQTGGELYHYLQRNLLKIPFILCSSDKPEQHMELHQANLAGAIQKPNIKEPLTRIIDGLVLLKDIRTSRPLNYCPVKISTLLRLGQMPCDIHIKLSESKFIKILKKDAQFTEEFFTRYKSKGTEFLFINSNNLEILLETLVQAQLSIRDLDRAQNLSEQILNILDAITDTSLKEELTQLNQVFKQIEKDSSSYMEILKVSEKTHQTIQKSIKKLGITGEVQDLIKSSVKLSMDTIQKLPELEELFARLKNNPENYISTHSTLLGHVACSIANRLGWSSELTLYKLSLAAFLHDITIEHQEHAKIVSRKDLNVLRGTVSDEVYLEIATHPEECASLVRKLRQIPPDVDQIILEHHEWPEAEGFPYSKVAHEISPLSSVFIFAHAMVDYMIDHPHDSHNFDNFYRSEAKHFRRGLFKKIFTEMAGFSPEVGKVKVK